MISLSTLNKIKTTYRAKTLEHDFLVNFKLGQKQFTEIKPRNIIPLSSFEKSYSSLSEITVLIRLTSVKH
jgi:hypothetical protein